MGSKEEEGPKRKFPWKSKEDFYGNKTCNLNVPDPFPLYIA